MNYNIYILITINKIYTDINSLKKTYYITLS